MASYAKTALLALLTERQAAWIQAHTAESAAKIAELVEGAKAEIEALKAFVKRPSVETALAAYGAQVSIYAHQLKVGDSPYGKAFKFVNDYPAEKIPLTVVQYTKLLEGTVPGQW